MAKIKVLYQGTFDILNYGHIRGFEAAKSAGDYLIVALNSNALVSTYKKRVAVQPWWHKKAIIESIKYVDKVIKAPDFSPLKLLKKHDIDVYVIGDEWVESKAKEIAYMKGKGGEVVIIPRFGGVATSEIKRKLLAEHLQATQSAVVPRSNYVRRGRQAVKRAGNLILPKRGATRRAAGAVR